ncbi:hypothetical protein PFISCL1PPCAC_3534, partial [Pristionchus fissidentatus]
AAAAAADEERERRRDADERLSELEQLLAEERRMREWAVEERENMKQILAYETQKAADEVEFAYTEARDARENADVIEDRMEQLQRDLDAERAVKKRRDEIFDEARSWISSELKG